MNKKYLYPKECFLKGNNELMLKNQKVLNEYITEKIKITIFDINGTFVLLIPYAIPTDIVSKFKITHKITIFIIILLHLTKKCQPLHNMK